jgi:hypothetical protein
MSDHIDIPLGDDALHVPISTTDAAWIFMQGGGKGALARIAALEQHRHAMVQGDGRTLPPERQDAKPAPFGGETYDCKCGTRYSYMRDACPSCGLIHPKCDDVAKPGADEAAATMVASLLRNGRYTAASMVERQATEIAALRRELATMTEKYAPRPGMELTWVYETEVVRRKDTICDIEERDKAHAELAEVKELHNYMTFIQVKKERDDATAELAAERAMALLRQIGDPDKASAYHSCIEIDTYCKDGIDGVKWMNEVRALIKEDA